MDITQFRKLSVDTRVEHCFARVEQLTLEKGEKDERIQHVLTKLTEVETQLEEVIRELNSHTRRLAGMEKQPVRPAPRKKAGKPRRATPPEAGSPPPTGENEDEDLAGI